MAKAKKKRTKVYRGSDAKNAPPQIVRVSAVNRSAPQQWLYDHRKQLKAALIIAGIVILLIIMIIGIAGIVTNS